MTLAAIDWEGGFESAWNSIATFVPKLVGFLLILVIGYLLAKLLRGAVEALLERVGFDRWVERGPVKDTLARSRFDASDILAQIAFLVAFLFVLQLAFGVFGPNPVSDLLEGVIAFLPKLFVAIVIVVIAVAVGAVVNDLTGAALRSVSGGTWIARGAGLAIVVLGVFAALSHLEVAPMIVNGLFYALLVTLAGAGIVAIGGGGIPTMRRYWDRWAAGLEDKAREVQAKADPDAVTVRVEQARETMGQPGPTAPAAAPTSPGPPMPPAER